MVRDDADNVLKLTERLNGIWNAVKADIAIGCGHCMLFAVLQGVGQEAMDEERFPQNFVLCASVRPFREIPAQISRGKRRGKV